MGFLVRRLIFMVAPVLWRKFQQRRRSKQPTGEGPESSGSANRQEESVREGYE